MCLYVHGHLSLLGSHTHTRLQLHVDTFPPYLVSKLEPLGLPSLPLQCVSTHNAVCHLLALKLNYSEREGKGRQYKGREQKGKERKGREGN